MKGKIMNLKAMFLAAVLSTVCFGANVFATGFESSGGTEDAYAISVDNITTILQSPAVRSAVRFQFVTSIIRTDPYKPAYLLMTTNCKIDVELRLSNEKVVANVTSKKCWE